MVISYKESYSKRCNIIHRNENRVVESTLLVAFAVGSGGG